MSFRAAIILIALFGPLPIFPESSTDMKSVTEQQRSFLEDASEDASSSMPSTAPNMSALLTKTVILLAGLCGVVIAGAYLVRRIGGGRFNSFSTEGAICLVERKYLSPKTSLWLVEIHKQPFLIIDSQQSASIHHIEASPANTEKNL